MRDGGLAIDEVALVLRVEHRSVHVPASEPPHRIEGVPEAERDELGALSVLSAKEIGGTIARGLPNTP
jgi:hypothetical protein